MKLTDIIALGKIDSDGRGIAEAYAKSPTFNAPFELAKAEGREKEPGLANIIALYENKNPIEHTGFIEQYVGANGGVLTDAVLGNRDVAIKGLAHKDTLAAYLLEDKLKPGKFGPSDEWNKTYATARDAHIVLKDERGLAGLAEGYVAGQVDSLKKKKVSAGMLNAVGWVYQNEPGFVIESIKAEKKAAVRKFLESFKVADGQKYVANRLNSLKGDDQKAEAYRIGRTVYDSSVAIAEEKKAAEEAKKKAKK